MSGMEGLGRSFNVVPTAADTTYINMAYASGVTFVCVGADTYTVQSSATASGGALTRCRTGTSTSSACPRPRAWSSRSRTTCTSSASPRTCPPWGSDHVGPRPQQGVPPVHLRTARVQGRDHDPADRYGNDLHRYRREGGDHQSHR